jgi:hypothetical protein
VGAAYQGEPPVLSFGVPDPWHRAQHYEQALGDLADLLERQLRGLLNRDAGLLASRRGRPACAPIVAVRVCLQQREGAAKGPSE